MRKYVIAALAIISVGLIGCGSGAPEADNSASQTKQQGKTPDGKEVPGSEAQVPDK